MQSFIDNCDQHVIRDGSPDLSFHRIFAVPVESIDPKMLLDPTEKVSICQRLRYSSVTVRTDRWVLLVRNTNVFAVSGSLNLIRRSWFVRITFGAVAINRMRVESSRLGAGFGA